jgi:predicted transcriptional regulator
VSVQHLVPVDPELDLRLQQHAKATGKQPADIINEALWGYLRERGEINERIAAAVRAAKEDARQAFDEFRRSLD